MRRLFGDDWDDPEVQAKKREDIAEAMSKVRPPEAWMGQLTVQEVPAELAHLRAVADCIYGMALYENNYEGNLKCGLWIIEHVRRDLNTAEGIIQGALGVFELATSQAQSNKEVT